MLKTLAVIPARGVSKGIPKKNVRLLNGKPLIAYSIEARALRSRHRSRHINRVLVSTEDQEIAEVSKRYGAEVIDRPKELARDDLGGLDPTCVYGVMKE